MTGFFKKAMEAYEQQQVFGKVIGAVKGDKRYKQPKEDPKASQEKVEETIESTEIYRRAKELILNAQRKQVAYGLDKYPEPLNADTWTEIETIDHIIDESIDKLHYLVMLRIKLEKMAEREKELKERNARLNNDVTRTFNFRNKQQADQFQRVFEKFSDHTKIYADGQLVANFKTPKDADKFRKEWEETLADVDSMYPSAYADGEPGFLVGGNLKNLDKAYSEIELNDYGTCNLGAQPGYKVYWGLKDVSSPDAPVEYFEEGSIEHSKLYQQLTPGKYLVEKRVPVCKVPLEHSKMNGYSMADVEATLNMWKDVGQKNLDDKFDALATAVKFAGADIDGDKVLETKDIDWEDDDKEPDNIIVHINMHSHADPKAIAKSIAKELKKHQIKGGY